MEEIHIPKTYHFEDFNIDQVNELNVGRKGLSLFQMHHSDVPVPDFFVISPQVFSQYVEKAFKDKGEELLNKGVKLEYRDIHAIFMRKDFEKDLKEEIHKQYTKLSGFSDAWVSVRSSVSYPNNHNVSFSGIFSTKLNVRGIEHLFSAVKELYAEYFSDLAIRYCVNEGVEISEVKLAVVVQRMIQPEVSGIAFTTDPITQNHSRMSVEAVYGLGDVISQGELTPDMYALDKKNLTILEKHIAPQEWMKIRTVGHNKLENSEKIQISPAWSHKQKLEDKYIVEISKLAILLEEKLKTPQDIEWVLGNGRLWILQTKPVTQPNFKNNVSVGYFPFVNDSTFKVVKEFVNKQKDYGNINQQALEEAQKMVMKEATPAKQENTLPAATLVQTPAPVMPTTKNLQFVLSGIGASFGHVDGTAKIIRTVMDVVNKGEIAIIPEYTPELSSCIINASGVVTQQGGLTSDIAIMCREMKIPAVVGASMASELIGTGDVVSIDGNSGNIHRIAKAAIEEKQVAQQIQQTLQNNQVKETYEKIVEIQNPQSPVEVKKTTSEPKPMKDSSVSKTATKVYVMADQYSDELVNTDGIAYLSLDNLILADGRHPLAYLADGKYKDYGNTIAKQVDQYAEIVSPNELIVSIGNATVNQFKELTRGKEFESKELNGNTFGSTRYLENKKALDVALRIIKRTRNILHDRNVSIAVHSPMNGVNMKELKKEINASGLRRTTTFNIYAVIENPSEILLLKEIMDADIDGLIINTPMLAKYMQGISFDDTTTKYDLNTGSIMTILDQISDMAKNHGARTIVVTEGSTPLIKYCVKKGFYGISTNVADFKETKKMISSEETKMLLSL